MTGSEHHTAAPYGTALRPLVDDLSYPEGPLVHDRRVYWVEYARHALRAFDPDSGRLETIWQQEGFGPAAVARAADGSWWLTGSDGGALLRLDALGRPDRLIAADDDGGALPGPNDLVFDRHGRLWFTVSGVFDPAAPPAGGVYCHDGDGRVRQVVGDLHYANGIALTNDGRTCFVAEHLRNRIVAFELSADGRLTRRRLFADLARLAPLASDEPLLGPDGLACATNGDLVVAQFGGGRLLHLHADGSLAAIVPVPLRYPTNVAFDADEQTLLVTAMGDNQPPYSGALFAKDWP